MSCLALAGSPALSSRQAHACKSCTVVCPLSTLLLLLGPGADPNPVLLITAAAAAATPPADPEGLLLPPPPPGLWLAR